MRVEFLWFDDCPNHAEARTMLQNAMEAAMIDEPVIEIDATDPDIAMQVRFPGSPTIRINGEDIEPGHADPGDYTPRCRLYHTASGLRGVPERLWIEQALIAAKSASE